MQTKAVSRFYNISSGKEKLRTRKLTGINPFESLVHKSCNEEKKYYNKQIFNV